MKSLRTLLLCESNRYSLGMARHIALALSLCFAAGAQPAALSTLSLPFSGPTLFDAAGNMYNTGSAGPVTIGAAQTAAGGGLCPPGGPFGFAEPCSDAHITKTGPTGNTIFGSLLGGAGEDYGTALAVDSAGNMYVAGYTGGSFPTTANGAVTASTSATIFAAKLSADGSHFIYATYLPNTSINANAIAVDSQGNAYVIGQTAARHAYVTKLSADGSSFLYTVNLAGSGRDSPLQVTVDSAGDAIVAGLTTSADFPVTAGALQPHLAGAQNLFVAKLDGAGRTLFSTYLGGSGTDAPNALQLDSAGNLYVAGSTSSFDFPVTAGSFEPTPIVPLWNDSAPGGFVTKLSADGSALVYSSYVMSLDELLSVGVAAITPGTSGDVYVAGLAGAGFPTTASAPQPCFGGPVDAFVAHLDAHGALLDATYVPNGNPVGGANAVEGMSLAGDGSLLLAWHTAGNNNSSQIHFGSAGWTAPVCVSPEVLNAATFYADGSVTPGELVSLTGFGIGPGAGVSYQPDAQGMVPRQLAGVQVLFDNQPAPVLYAQSRQVNAMAPVELSGKSTTVVTLVYNNVPIGSATLQVTFGAPGLFRLQPGVSAQALAVNPDGTLNGSSNPAAAGTWVMLLGTGFGLTDPACATGGLNYPGTANLQSGLSAIILSGGTVIYSGSAPTLLCGITQINMQIPSNATAGAIFLEPVSKMAISGGFTSSGTFQGSTIYVK